MIKNFLIDCKDLMDITYESDRDSSLPILTQLRIDFHLLVCPDCSRQLRSLRNVEEAMRTDFFPPSPDFGEAIMERLGGETCEEAYVEEAYVMEETDAPAGFSFRSWVIIGFFLLLSLPSSFFGMNFIEIANAEGLSFLLPVGITIGIVVTCYGALFIGSHLKELSNRFGLH